MVAYKLDDAVIEALSARKLWEYFYSKASVEEITQDILIKLSKEAFNLVIEDGILCAIDSNGDKISIPDDEFGVNYCGEWLSDYLPAPSFDVAQSGNVRKADEAESIYCALVVRAALNDVEFDKDFEQVAKNYDYDKMIGKGAIDSFKTLLESWQQYQSFIVKVSVSAAKYFWI